MRLFVFLKRNRENVKFMCNPKNVISPGFDNLYIYLGDVIAKMVDDAATCVVMQ